MSEGILNQESAPAEPVASDSSISEPTAPVAESATTDVESAPVANEVNFLDTISEDLRGEGNLKDFKDVNALAKSYLNAQQMLGKSVRMPADDASPEAKQEFLSKIADVDGVLLSPTNDAERDAFLNKLGRPEASDGYDFQGLIADDLQAVVPGMQEELADFQSIAHEAGLTNEQAQKLVSMRMGTLKHEQERQAVVQEETIADLKKTWGTDYDNRLAAAKATAKIYQEKYPTQMDSLINGPAGNNPAFLNMLSEMAVMFKEAGHAGMAQTDFGVTPEQAKDKIAQKRADPGFMKDYNDNFSPNHQAAIDELARLYKLSVG